jgi:hypothetical protein
VYQRQLAEILWQLLWPITAEHAAQCAVEYLDLAIGITHDNAIGDTLDNCCALS